MNTENVIISVGSNIDPVNNIAICLELLQSGLRVTGSSVFYITKPVGNPDQDDFVNGAFGVRTDIPALELKYDFLREIESILGRQRTNDKNEARTIDLDIILYGDEVYESDDLVIPDPGLSKYPFVALPVMELVGDIAIPGTGFRLASLFTGNPDAYGFRRQEEITSSCRRTIGLP